MSSHDLEQALREFINGELEDRDIPDHDDAHDYHNDQRFADRDHEHDGGDFVSQVDYYLNGFVPQEHQGCSTKQSFQDAVMACVEYWMNNGGSGETDTFRPMLKAVMSVARSKVEANGADVIAALARCLEDLRRIGAVPTGEASDNGLTYSRV